MYHVYVMQSLASGRRYIGSTEDLERRLADHNRGKNFSVRGRGPFRIVYTETFATRTEAEARERRLKSFKGGNALRKLLALSPSSNG